MVFWFFSCFFWNHDECSLFLSLHDYVLVLILFFGLLPTDTVCGLKYYAGVSITPHQIEEKEREEEAVLVDSK